MKQVFELNLSADQYIKGLADINTSIRTLRQEQKELDLSTATGQQKFEQNAVAIKGLSEQYRLFQKEVANLGEKNNDLKTKTDAVNALMAKEATTINELNQQTAALNKVKKNLNIENEEEKALIDQINKKIDENTNKVKANSSEVEKQKMNVGNYTASIKDAFASINPLNDGLSGFISRSQEAGGTGKLFTQAMGGMVQGVWGLVKASLAFIATPIGAVITAIVLVVTTLYNVFKSFTPIVDKLEQSFAALSAVFSVVKNTIISLVTGAKSLGSAFKSLGGDMRDAAAAAIELKQAQQDLDDATDQQSINSAKARAESDKYLAMSKDLSKSETERAQLIQKSTDIMKKDFDERKKIQEKESEIALKSLAIKSGVSEKEIKSYGDDFAKMKEFVEKKGTALDDEFEAYKDSIVKKYEIAGEENQFIEKNISKQNALLETAQEKRDIARAESQKRAEEIKQKEIKDAQDEVSLYEAKEGSKQKSLTETLDYEKTLMDKRNAALEIEYKNGGKTLTEYETEKLNILKTYNDAVFQATSENLTKELELWKSQNAKKLADNKITSDAVLSGQLALQDTLYEKQKAVIDQTILDEQEKAIALQNLQNEHETAVKGIKDTFKQYQRDQEAVDYEIEQERLSLQFENELIIAQSQYEREKELLLQQLEDKKLTQEQYDQIMLNKKQEYENKMFQIESARQMASWDLQQKTVSVFGEVASAIGIKSKGLSIALTTIDTYFAAQKAYLSQFLPVPDPSSPARGTIAAVSAIASGIARVRQIANTKFSRGGWLNGRSHAGGGIPMTVAGVGGYEAEGGEAIINKRSSALYRPILSAINQAGGGVAFAQGGLTTGSDRVTDAIFNQIDITSQLSKIKVVNVAEETAVLYNGILKVENRANV